MADYKIDIEASAKKLLDKIQERFGISAERLLELARADQAGLCMPFPFKVGDTVWANISVQGDHYRWADMPYPVKIIYMGIGETGFHFNVMYKNGRTFPFLDSDVGCKVFGSYDEAVAALIGRKPDAEK